MGIITGLVIITIVLTPAVITAWFLADYLALSRALGITQPRRVVRALRGAEPSWLISSTFPGQPLVLSGSPPTGRIGAMRPHLTLVPSSSGDIT